MRLRRAESLSCSARRPRRSIRAQRTCAGRSHAPASAAAGNRMLQGETKVSGTRSIIDARCMVILCERPKQNAPGQGTRGRSHWPREIGVTDLHEWNQSLVEQHAVVQAFIARTRQRIAIESRPCSWFGNDEEHDGFSLMPRRVRRGCERYGNGIINASAFSGDFPFFLDAHYLQ